MPAIRVKLALDARELSSCTSNY